MPGLYFRNVPSQVKFHHAACYELYGSVAAASGVTMGEVEVHIEDTQYRLIGPDGRDYPHGVHVFVEWHEGRSDEAKKQIAKAIHGFLDNHDLRRGSNITFRDLKAGSFYFEGKRVPGGPPPT